MRSYERRGARVEVWRDLRELSARAAELFESIAHGAVNDGSRFTVALSGGSTPKALYQHLAGDEMRDSVLWQQTHVYWSDERCVPPLDEQSNYRMAHDALLARVNIPTEQIHRMRGEDEPASAAREYEEILKRDFGASAPRLNLILLGLGEDGHTASLFPHSDVLFDTEDLVAAPYVEKFATHRLTFTFRVINNAANIIFLVSGKQKSKALRAVLEENVDQQAWPASMVHPVDGKLVWLVDEEAFEE
ncbi:MAG: 6-phosphogluconolactonase [Pyrinomonadaceae bacterium]